MTVTADIWRRADKSGLVPGTNRYCGRSAYHRQISTSDKVGFREYAGK